MLVSITVIVLLTQIINYCMNTCNLVLNNNFTLTIIIYDPCMFLERNIVKLIIWNKTSSITIVE